MVVTKQSTYKIELNEAEAAVLKHLLASIDLGKEHNIVTILRDKLCNSI